MRIAIFSAGLEDPVETNRSDQERYLFKNLQHDVTHFDFYWSEHIQSIKNNIQIQSNRRIGLEIFEKMSILPTPEFGGWSFYANQRPFRVWSMFFARQYLYEKFEKLVDPNFFDIFIFLRKDVFLTKSNPIERVIRLLDANPKIQAIFPDVGRGLNGLTDLFIAARYQAFYPYMKIFGALDELKNIRIDTKEGKINVPFHPELLVLCSMAKNNINFALYDSGPIMIKKASLISPVVKREPFDLSQIRFGQPEEFNHILKEDWAVDRYS